MDIAAILGAALGLAFVFLLLSLVCSTIQEWVAAVLRRRAANLRQGLQALLDGKENVDKLFSDPMLTSIMARGIITKKARPRSVSYLPAERFSNALLGQFVSAAFAPSANIVAELEKLPAS
ncbi:MAG TPA: hypothetical protein VE010_14410, partial [Thermoanaerobaculia bacterium]|nr:hypothetical protein [Thermoanaerobaculia bacterium]